MIDAEDEGIPAVLTPDPEDEDGVVMFLAPKWNLAGITPIRPDQQLCELVKFTMLPGYENLCVLVIGFSKFYNQVVNLSVAKLRIDWKFTSTVPRILTFPFESRNYDNSNRFCS